MIEDHSWDVSAAEYVKLYEALQGTAARSAAPNPVST